MHILNPLGSPRTCPVNSIFILTPQALTPRQVVVDLDEVIVPQHGLLGLQSFEHVQHAFLQFLFVLRYVARRVDLRQRHSEFVFQAPEACEKDGTRQEVILAVWQLGVELV